MNKHQDLVDMLVKRLKGYDSIEKNILYSNKGLCGEVDVESWRNVQKENHGLNRWYHFYEVKSRHSTKNYLIARKQFYRYRKAFPNRKIKGIYVSPELVRRML